MKVILVFFSLLFGFLVSHAQIINTVAGGGLGNADSALKVGMWPNGVTADTLGNIYISDGINNTIRKVNIASNILTAIAGNGTPGYTGDGGQATAAQLNNAQGVAIDRAGNVYEADYLNNAIRMVNPSGIISTYAGIGISGFSGDGGPATIAELNSPIEVSTDGKGNVYIADYYNQRIRMVNSAGIITTIAGNGVRGHSGDGGPATAAELFLPDGVAADTAGNVFIADQFSNRIRKVNTAGIISTVVGNGSPGYSGDGGQATNAEIFSPSTVFVDVHGNIFVADQYNNRVREVNTAGIITTVAGNGIQGFSGDGGQATAAELAYNQGLTVDKSGNIFIADYSNDRIRMVNTSGIITTVSGNGSQGYYGNGIAATAAELLSPYSVAFDSPGNMYIADNGNYRVREVNTLGVITTIAGNGRLGFSGDGGQATAAKINFPTCVATDAAGNIYIADDYNQRIRKVSTAGIISTIAGDTGRGYTGDGMQATATELNYPNGIALDASGNLYIADGGNNRIRKVSPSGIISTIAGDSVGGYGGDGGPATAAELAFPTGVAIDGSGNIYIADKDNNCVRKVNNAGVISTIAGNQIGGYSGDGGPATAAELDYPYSVNCDSYGNIYVADNLNNAIRMINTSGIISTVAGNEIKGFWGDGGLATAAEVYAPYGVTVASTGDIYIADTQNKRIRTFNPGSLEGFDKVSSPETCRVFPNPNNGRFTIELANSQQPVANSSVEIYNVLGEKVYGQFTMNKRYYAINMAGNPSGLYLFRIIAEDGEPALQGKFIIQ